ncbi:hypothetical protein J3458_009379 [Metarhizium acridum]|nr:hypothetical protein J3458_009379 [Metarhizium acridum]
MATVAQEQKEFEDILEYINSIEQANLSQMVGSASSARSRRKKSKTMPKPADEELEKYQRRRAGKEESIGLMWQKIHELQQEEKRLKEMNGM